MLEWDTHDTLYSFSHSFIHKHVFFLSAKHCDKEESYSDKSCFLKLRWTKWWQNRLMTIYNREWRKFIKTQRKQWANFGKRKGEAVLNSPEGKGETLQEIIGTKHLPRKETSLCAKAKHDRFGDNKEVCPSCPPRGKSEVSCDWWVGEQQLAMRGSQYPFLLYISFLVGQHKIQLLH